MALGWIKRDARGIPDAGRNRLQPVEPRFQRAAGINRAHRDQRFGESPGGIEQRQIGRPGRAAQSARILGIELAPHRFDLLREKREGLGAQRIDQIGQREIDRYTRQSRRFQRLDAKHNRLARSRDSICPDQLGAQLQAFARGIELARLDHHRIPAIGQPQRTRRGG